MRNAMWVGRGITGMGGIPMLGTGARGLTTLIKDIFRNNEQGFAYDPNDLTTLYQDAAGTIPVTAAGQPVGLILDKSKGSATGINLHTTDTPINTTSYPATGTRSGLDITVSQKTSGYAAVSLGMPTVVGKTYLLELIAPDLSGFWVLVSDDLTSDTLNRKTAISSALTSRINTKITLVFTATAPMSYIHLNRGTTHTNPVTFKDVSCREVLGNHAFQTVSSSRPILRQTPILGTTEYVQNGTFDSDISGWSVVGSSTTKAVAWESGALKVSASKIGTCVSSGTLSTPLVIGKTYEVSCECLAYDATGGLSSVFIGDGSQTVGSVTGTGKFKFLVTATTNTSKINFGRMGSGVTSEAFSKWDNISVKEVTGYRTDQNYLVFDGVDDFLQTNNIDFSGTDEVSLFAGVRKLSDAARAILVELSSASGVNNGSFSIEAPRVTGVQSGEYATLSQGTQSSVTSTGVGLFAAPNSAIITLKSDIAKNSNSLKVNSNFYSSQTVLGTGNYGNYPLYIGRRAGTSLPFNGRLYGLIGIGRLTSDNETIALEKAIAKNTGVMLNV